MYDYDKNLFPAFWEDAQEWRINTTFTNDFKIAERFGLNAVKDTFKRAFDGWKNNAKYMCELTVVMNHLCLDAAERGDDDMGQFYFECYYKCKDWCFSDEAGYTKEDHDNIFKVLD